MLSPALVDAVRPLDTEDTGVLDPGAGEVEASLDLARQHDASAFGGRLVVSLGVLPRLEARVETGVVAVDRPSTAASAGAGDSLAGFKYRVLDESSHAPAVLLATAVRLPTGDEERGFGVGDTAVITLAAVSRTWASVTLTANAGYVFSVAGRSDDTVLASLAAEQKFGPAWTLLGEFVAVFGVGDQRDHLITRLGAAWQARSHIRLDGAVATGIGRGSETLIVTIGTTFRF
ncbi:MAG TPA: transporter [Candidatus Acidoferrum sp.]|nr:transporter [Candidatus Acidoferrum sp.]